MPLLLVDLRTSGALRYWREGKRIMGDCEAQKETISVNGPLDHDTIIELMYLEDIIEDKRRAEILASRDD